MKDTLVSVIIPSYNVAAYIETCIRSIMQQSHKNLQIIPVNDGSTDETLSILESLAMLDNRIELINKPNEGVSAARNSGLAVAKGEYVVFIDGDDFVSTDFISYMISLAKIENAEFVLSRNCFTKSSEAQIEHDTVVTLSPSEATALLLSPNVIVGCWNKMFRREFLYANNLFFSTELFYGEGLNFITKSSQLSRHVTVGSRKVYYYRRNNEYSATSKYNINKYINGERAILKIEEELIDKTDSIMTMLALHKSMFCVGALSQTYAHNLQGKFRANCEHWKSVIRRNLPCVIYSRKISLYRKILIISGYLFPRIICKLDMYRRKKIAKQSVI